MKKIITFMLACMIGVTTLGTVACKDEEQSSGSMPVIERLELEKTSLLLTLGDRVDLPISYNEIEGGVLTWISSNPSVVSVDASGCVEALRIGTATVTANYGSKSVSCQVEVALEGNVPMIVFDGDVSETMDIAKGVSFELGAKVKFNGKIFEDAELEYFVMDESIGKMENGAFVAGDVLGSTQVNVFGVWRGQVVHAKTITINVLSENTVLLNGGRIAGISLYTTAQHEGTTYNTVETISSIYISEDGVQITDYELSVLDETVASIEKKGEIWEIKGKKAGETSLIVSYADKEFPFAIKVERPVFEVKTKMEYSVTDKKFLDESSKTLKDATQFFEGLNGITAYEIGGQIFELTSGELVIPEGKDRSVTLYDDAVGYKVRVDAYTLLMDELKDFEMIYAGDGRDVKGTYVLVKDIIEPTTVLTMPSGKVANNFAGIFDGRGHVLSFTFEHGTMHRFGLFGAFLNGATIKNLALNNITMDGTTGKNSAGIICGEGANGNAATPESMIENVFVDLKFSESRGSNLAFMGNAMWKTIMKNVIIHVPEVPESETYGSFARGDTASVANSYIISTAPTYVTTQEVSFKKVPVLYTTYNEMKEAGNDYSSFSSEFWDVSTYGIPVWKTLVNDFSL